ncbi:MAG: zinc-dependent peptidase [Planctomycetota bacterium]|nr:zinc-dependent peptidase [Planctomycetota bacterium]
MLPTPEILRGNRIGAAVLAALLGGLCPGAALLLEADGEVLAALGALGAGLGAGVYWLVTRRWRRRAHVLRRPFPPRWRKILEEQVAYYAALRADLQQRFRDMVLVFLAETPIQPVHCELDDVTRVLIAASAVIPVLNLPGWEYGVLREILVYPDYFDSAVGLEDEGYVDEEGSMGMVGETGTAFNGLMMLSGPDVVYGFGPQDPRDEVENVGIHEFAHLIDKADGFISGLPPGLTHGSRARWIAEVRKELRRPKRRSGIPEYAYTDEEEFFAVMVECFFTRPAKLAARHPELYTLLTQALRQDPRQVMGGKR